VSALDALLAAGRAAHEQLMVDTIRLERPAPDVYDPVTGDTGEGPAQVLYSGPARVKPLIAHSQDIRAGERAVVIRRYEVALPWTSVPAVAARVLPDDRATVTASPDPRLSGLVLWVTSLGESATATAWRIVVEDRS
jgi:hypothetical protein